MRAESLRTRLVLAASVWVVLATVLGGWALSYAFRETVADTFDSRLAALATALIGAVDVESSGELRLRRDPGESRFHSIYSGWYWLVADAAGPRLRSRSLWDMSLPIERPAAAAEPTFSDQTDATGRKLRVASQTVRIPGSDSPLTFVVSADAGELAAEIRRFDLLLTTALALLGCGLIAAVLAQVHFGLRPLARVATQIERVRTGRSEQLQRAGIRELDVLIDEVNSLIQHNQRLIERTRENVADLAHSLKTPLSVLKAELAAPQPDAATLSTQIGSMGRMISRRLSLAATAGTSRMSRTLVAPVIDDIVRGLGRVYAERSLTFSSEISPDARVRLEREDLEEIAGSLLENACKFARRRVRVSMAEGADRKVGSGVEASSGTGSRTETSSREGAGSVMDSSAIEDSGAGVEKGVRIERARLIVEDDGPGMSDEQAAVAVDRGRRFDSRTPGSGLGLAIVADIAEIYGGRLRLTRSELGGLRAEVELPR